jgi:hypothetical protein
LPWLERRELSTMKTPLEAKPQRSSRASMRVLRAASATGALHEIERRDEQRPPERHRQRQALHEIDQE